MAAAFFVQRVVDFLEGVQDVVQLAAGEVSGIKDVAQLFPGETAEAGVVRVELGAERRQPITIVARRRAGSKAWFDSRRACAN